MGEGTVDDGLGQRAVGRQERIGQVTGAPDDDTAGVGELPEPVVAVVASAPALPDAPETARTFISGGYLLDVLADMTRTVPRF